MMGYGDALYGSSELQMDVVDVPLVWRLKFGMRLTCVAGIVALLNNLDFVGKGLL